MGEDDWALWPDGTMCEMREVEEYLTFMSDDFEIVCVMEYGEDGGPVQWVSNPR